MTLDSFGRVQASERLPILFPITAPHGRNSADKNNEIELSPTMRADLLDLDAWGEILTTYGKTMKMAVALTDSDGHVLGKCHNPQPVWTMVHAAARDWTGCPFCISSSSPCTAVTESLRVGGVVRVRDLAGLTHVAVPLFVGKQHLGAIIAGQVFDQYPDPLPLRRVAKEFGISAQDLWDIARMQRPVTSAIQQASADLLYALGQAFVQQRYGAILEASLADTNGSFRLLVDGVRDHALFTIDPSGRVTSWNVGAERMFGYTDGDIVGENFSCMFSPEDIQNRVPQKQLNKALQTGRIEDEGWRIRANQIQFWADVNITVLWEERGTVRGFAVIVQDVTERKKIVIVLEEARQERARIQEKLLSHVSHELRTPLTAIYLFITNVLDGLLGDLNPEQHEHLTLALENVQQLKSMVGDLLDITRVQAHKLTVVPQRVSLAKLTADVLSTCRTNAALKNIGLLSEIAPDVPVVWADPVRLRQVLTNLIDNGIKFTPEHGVVTVRCKVYAEEKGFVCISVSDTGCGIGPENCEIVFERLAQVSSNSRASRSGLGLGLFISRDLVLRQGGRIWLESQLGRGSTFYLTVPVFSLAKLCDHIFTPPNLESGSVTLIVVDVDSIEEAVQAELVPEIRNVLERCIHPGQDTLLPAMSDAKSSESFFIVACADAKGYAVIAQRIARELQAFDNASRLNPVISSTTLPLAPGQSREAQTLEILASIERLIRDHLVGKKGDSDG
jgi:PAS domain S-box-containing protein